MIEIEQLRYVRLGTRNLPAAVDFAQRILGLQLIERNDEQATFRSDSRDHTLVYEVGDPMQQSVGLEVRTQATLDRAIAALAATGITATAAHAQALARRKARAMASFRDHSGNTFELVVRPQTSGWRYFPSRDAGVTGRMIPILSPTDSPVASATVKEEAPEGTYGSVIFVPFSLRSWRSVCASVSPGATCRCAVPIMIAW